MTLQKAMERLERHFIFHLHVPRAELDEAARIGIEALRNLRNQRATGIAALGYKLLGETEE